MTIRRTLLFILFALFAYAPPGRAEILKGVDIPMRDGVLLKADVHLPDGDGPFPAAIIRTPYDRTALKSRDNTDAFTQSGIAVVVVDTRGRFDSQGKFTPLAVEGPDGTDTLEWVLAQPWCNGRTATSGGSYVGYTQWAALEQPGAAIHAMVPYVTTADMYDLAYRNGAFNLATILGWSCTMHARNKVDTAAYLMAARAMTTLPLTSADNKAGFQLDFYDDWVSHPVRDAFWDPYNFRDNIPNMRGPALLVAGWFDLFLGPQIEDFMAVRKNAPPDVAAQSRLVIGPWDHSGALVSGLIELDPDNTLVEATKNMARGWFDHFLLDDDNSAAHMKPVRLFIMGANRWEFFDNWPPERTTPTPFYFHSDGTAANPSGGGMLNRNKPAAAEPPDTYTYDPRDPTPSRGGTLLATEMGPQDYAKVDERADVLSYTSAPLEQPLTIAGPVSVTLFAATDACGADFVARLMDLRPDGKAVSLAEGIIRTQSLGSNQPAPGAPHQYAIDLWATAYQFPAGHRMRVDIASAAFPHWDRNRNLCDAPAGLGKKTAPATQTIFHNPDMASHIILPVYE
jgi:hypothetical protein